MKDFKKGVIFAVLSPFFYSLRSLMVKLSPSITAEFYVLCTTIISFIFFSPIFYMYRSILIPDRLGLHFFRTFLAVPAIICSVYGFQHLALVDGMLLENSMPLFILLTVLGLKRRKVRTLSAFAILLGFCGLFFLLKPKLDVWNYAALASIGAAFLGALLCVMLSDLSKSNHSLTILFYSYLFAIPFNFFICSFRWQLPIEANIWGYIFLTSIFIACFRYTLIRAYTLLPPHVAGGWVYSGILFSAIWDWIFWKVGLDMWQILGGSIIIFSGLLVLKENQYFSEPVSSK